MTMLPCCGENAIERGAVFGSPELDRFKRSGENPPCTCQLNV